MTADDRHPDHVDGLPAEVEAQIERLRADIDETDAQLMDLLARRWGLSQQVIELRVGGGGEATDIRREEEVLANATRKAMETGLPVSLVVDVYRGWFGAVRAATRRRRS